METEMGNSQEGTDLLTSQMGADNPGEGTDAGQDNPAGQEDNYQVPPWKMQLSDDLKANRNLDKFDGYTSLARSYLELEGKMGNMISVPGEEASDEERAAFYGKIGRPETADKYDLSLKDGIPEYLKNSLAGSEESFRKRLHKSGVPQSAAAEIYNWIQDELKIGDEAMASFQKSQLEASEKTLREEWKGDFDKNVVTMTEGLKRFANDDFVNFAKQSGLANNAEFCRVFYRIGKAISEDGFIEGEQRVPKDFDWKNHKYSNHD